MTPDTVIPAGARGADPDGTPVTATPDSKSKAVRRSLQKTLREAHHHHPGSTHRHRRGNQSDGTIRSASGEVEEGPDGTLSLQREQGRFILHGKQASVIQFGNDWPNERMKLRREMWRQNSGSPNGGSPKDEDTLRQQFPNELESAAASPSTARGLAHGADVSDSEVGSEGTPHSYTFREDAEAAEAFATASPEQLSSKGSGGEPASYFDLSQWDPNAGKRQTIIGPQTQQHKMASLQKGEDGTVESDEEDFSLGPREHRRTVIGPSIRVNGSAASGTDGSPAHAGAEEKEDETLEDDSMISSTIDDDELRRISQQPQKVQAA